MSFLVKRRKIMETISKIIESWEQLSLNEKEYTFEILHKNIIESKRELLLQRIEEAKSNYLNGKTQSGNVDDLFEQLDND